MPKKQLGLGGTVAIGLASMLGAGVFVVFATAYKLATDFIFWSIALAAAVASLNAWSIYQLARQVDRPGGVYAYSRVYTNNSLSFLSGLAFVIGKISSIAAIALVFEGYVFPGQTFWPAALAISFLATINILGINRTATVAAVLSASTITFFVGLIGLALVNPTPGNMPSHIESNSSIQSIFMAAGVIFFAFAGYARVATLGNEVRNPKVNIPRAIFISLGAVLVIYLALAAVSVQNLGANLAQSTTPVADLEQLFTGKISITPLVASLACLGSMLALLAGVSRTMATMAEDSELPKVLQVRNRYGSPWLAELFISAGAIILVGFGGIVLAIGFSSFSVLFYYGVGHLSAMSQSKSERVMPRPLNVLGIILCILLSTAFGWETFVISVGILATAWLVRALWKFKTSR
ncbi:MAG: hypothetical protein RL670_1045 [Actinomycetota bacterium]|jgi:APA family basic amino acid/polyamine antiporter